MNALTQWHIDGCPGYRAIWPDWKNSTRVEDLPFLHVGVFKKRLWQTAGAGVRHQRVLKSSATSNAGNSRISLDERSSTLQAASSSSILRDALGGELRPLIVLDHAKSLLQRGETSARIAAALSLRPLASALHFVMAEDPAGPRLLWDQIAAVCAQHDHVRVYGFTWLLWQTWATAEIPDTVRQVLARTRIQFVHSGGWKKLEAQAVDRAAFDRRLIATGAPNSQVLDFYGLVEQVGVIFPLCPAGHRHIPRWALALTRDPWTLDCVREKPGMLQLMNTLSFGAPYHNVLTEDIGVLHSTPCPCGRAGPHFDLHGRIPKAEVRGCANV
ncbi:hypothetical protein K0B96_03925 [Horticoccus luteus]|uniref:Acyl-protein synthetase LuxE domain-containing protein n=1 Tax=Horticoccus luteus TaxID=2862869 RepID=A0A8F9TX65_9BACT|nr:hypothetical protein [Horticoccus luteus]QYM79775.1 hypothetical protein K0B96_03925 [Horticoccus luteus]